MLAATLCPATAARSAKPPQADPIQISIGGGPVDSAAFQFSSALADTLSRPPGLPECDPAGPCGIPGVIAGAQTFDDPGALLDAVAAGRTTTALIPALRLQRARCHAPAPAGLALRALKILYRQPLQIIVRGGDRISSPADFTRRPIAIGETGSDTEALALAMLDAYGLTKAKVKLLRLPQAQVVAAVGDGRAVAGFILGDAVDAAIGGLIARGYTLMSLADGPERHRLLQALPVFEADAFAPNAYPGLPATSTVSQPVLWVAGPAVDEGLAQTLVAAESEPHNLSRISELVRLVKPVPAGEAFLRLAVPPAAGAAAFARAAHLPLATLDCPAGGR
jgi:hypothetical protein